MYVAVVLDLFSRRAVGWSMKADRDASLVMDAFMMAVWRRGRLMPCFIIRTVNGLPPVPGRPVSNTDRPSG